MTQVIQMLCFERMAEDFMHPDFEHVMAESTRRGETFLDKAGQLDAVVCGNDFLALGLIAAAAKKGFRVPGDLLVTGADDYAHEASSAGVALTTYQIPDGEMGCKMFEILQARLDGMEPVPGETQFRGSLVIRESA